MKKIYLTLLLLLPAFFANAAGPILTWNFMLDDFIPVFNQIDDTQLAQLYADNGVDGFVFTYFDPETGDVIKECMISDENGYNNVSDDVMNRARAIALSHLQEAYKKNSRINQVVNEFAKRNTNLELMYSTLKDDRKITKKVMITPNEIKSGR